MLRIENLVLAPGGAELLSDAQWHIRPGEKLGLVGRNGTGKSTLLRAMVGEQSQDEGHVHLRAGISLGYLPQHAVSGSEKTVWEEVRTGLIRIGELRRRLDDLERRVSEGDVIEVPHPTHGHAFGATEVGGGEP